MKKNIVSAGLVIFCCSLRWACLSMATPQSGSYRVEFTGTPGAKVYGSVGWLDLNDSSETLHSNKVLSDLPATVFLSPPSDIIVVASGLTIDQGDVTIKIYHNGIECGKHYSLGRSRAELSSKSCLP